MLASLFFLLLMTATRLPLSFDLTVTEAVHEDEFQEKPVPRPYLSVEAWPVVGGHRVIEGRTSYVFDTVMLLSHGTEPSDFDPFTCSCGVAGCVGIHENVQLEADADEVRWVFPEEPFRKELNPALAADGVALVLRFDRLQYEAALADLEKRILGLAEQRTLPVVVPPDSHPNLDEPFGEKLAAQREHTARWIADARHRKVIFNKLLDTDIAVTFPFGAHYEIAVSRLAWEMADNITGDDYEDRDRVLEEEVLPVLHGGDEAILAAVRALSWEQVSTFIWWDRSAGGEYVPLENRADMPDQWANAQLVVRYRP